MMGVHAPAFSAEHISEVKTVDDVSGVKHLFSEEVKEQWSKVSKRPAEKVHLFVGQELGITQYRWKLTRIWLLEELCLGRAGYC